VKEQFIKYCVCKIVTASFLNINLAKMLGTITNTSWVLLICSRETTTNSSFCGPTYLHKVESHWRDFMFISIVLDAFVTSVIYKPPYMPPVRFCNNKS
jgi:hypothetical protein